MKRLYRSPPGKKLIMALVCVLITGAWCLSPWGKAADLFCYDLFFLLRGPRPPANDIVIVAIDEPSFGIIGKQWPWPRSLHADLIDALYKAGAKTVAMDILFPEASAPMEDAALRDALARHPSCIVAADISRVEKRTYSRNSIVSPHPSLSIAPERVGYIHFPVDPDGFVRKSRLGSFPEQALALAAVRRHLGPGTAPPRSYTDGGIDFSGPPGTVHTISYYQALSPDIHLPACRLKDKLVFVGFSTQNFSNIQQQLPDHFPTPFTRWGYGYMSGVEIHANLAAGLIHGTLITILPAGTALAAGLGICFLTSGVLTRRRLFRGGVLVACCWVLIGSFAFVLFIWKEIYLSWLFICLPVTGLYLVSPFVYYIETRREKIYIRRAFSTYVAPSVVRQLMDNPQQLALGGEEREITAFFSDIEGFSGISEQLTPTGLVGLLNEFLTEMTDIILSHQGTVDKFEGDAIIAMFGAPNALPDHAARACLAAISMQDRLASLRENWRSRGLPPLKMRIGLCTGPAVVGNMGSRQRMDYTMMGDTVNTASRLEGVNKAYHTCSLISESTRLAAGSAIAARQIDLITVMGKTEPLRVYEPMGVPGQLPPSTRKVMDIYGKGLQLYQQRNWGAASDLFEQVLAIRPEDGPGRILLHRCLACEKHPPGPDWQGVHRFMTK